MQSKGQSTQGHSEQGPRPLTPVFTLCLQEMPATCSVVGHRLGHLKATATKLEKNTKRQNQKFPILESRGRKQNKKRKKRGYWRF